MRNTLLIHQNTSAWNGLSEGDEDVLMPAAGDIQHRGVEVRALMHGGREQG
jgi:hypothetical protein